MYHERMESELKAFKLNYPDIDKVITKIKQINNMPSFEFDYNIERELLMFIECKKILEK